MAAAVRHAREQGLPLTVRGGHSTAGLTAADGALMLDLSAMKAVTVDPAAGIEAGLVLAGFPLTDGRPPAHGRPAGRGCRAADPGEEGKPC